MTAQAVPVQAVGAGALDVSPALAVLEDAEGSLTLPEVLAADRAGRMVPRPGASQGLSLGFTRSAFWLRLEVRNPGPAVAHQLLEVSNARISHVSFFVPDDAGRYTETRTGGDLPFATRAVAHRHLVFPLQVAPQATQVVYLRVQSTIGLAHNLGLTVVAEGVETDKAWALLARLGCDEGQGYGIGRPMPSAEFLGWVRRWEAPSNEALHVDTDFAQML